MMERSVKALGGIEAATGWKTSVSRGLLKANWPGWGELQAECTYYIQKPDKIVLDQDFSAYDHPFFFRYTYNAGEAWVMVNLSVRQNPRYNEMLEKGLRRVDGVAYFLENSDSLFIVEDVSPDSLLAGIEFARIGAIDGSDTIYYDLDTRTWLPVRSMDRNERGGWNHNVYGDYREVDGYQVPFQETTYVDGAKNRELIWRSIEFDVHIDPEEFEKNRPRSSG
jgi:hypothetical protein